MKLIDFSLVTANFNLFYVVFFPLITGPCTFLFKNSKGQGKFKLSQEKFAVKKYRLVSSRFLYVFYAETPQV